jgi:hypothetical protein
MLTRTMPGEQWARMRVWAAARKHESSDAATLCRILDSAEDLRERHPLLAGQLWRSARALADRMGYAP